MEERVAVGGQHNLVGLEAKSDDGHLRLRDGETIDNGKSDVLVVHNLKHAWDHGLACRV